MPSSLNLGSNPRQTIDDIRRLADDLEHLLLHGGCPSDAMLAGAPLLDRWGHALAPSPALTGIITNHPLLRDGRRIVTSNLIAIDPVFGFAPTWSRFYRLGSSCSFRRRGRRS